MNPGHHDTFPDHPGQPDTSPGGRLERVLRSGRFAVTGELNPPDSADPEDTFHQALVLSRVCDAINATDASGANCHMSSIGICALLTRADYSLVLQISCRDRNRIAIQGNVLGAAAMGVRNILCITGDGVETGDQPEAKPVFDLDSITLLQIIRTMRDEGVFNSGRKITSPPRVFLGAAANPFAPPHDWRPTRLAMKIEAGARFVQTQYCYDIAMLERYMAAVRDMGLDKKCFILVGVGPLASARTGNWIRNNVPAYIFPTRSSSASNGQKVRRQRVRKSASNSSSRSGKFPALPACTSWLTAKKSSSPKSFWTPAY